MVCWKSKLEEKVTLMRIKSEIVVKYCVKLWEGEYHHVKVINILHLHGCFVNSLVNNKCLIFNIQSFAYMKSVLCNITNSGLGPNNLQITVKRFNSQVTLTSAAEVKRKTMIKKSSYNQTEEIYCSNRDISPIGFSIKHIFLSVSLLSFVSRS